jgi:hypothetical protein
MSDKWDGVPLNPELNRFHWLLRKGEQWPEAWRWNPDADGCGTEYSGAWAESEGDGQPEGMAKWYRYLGPCFTPVEVDARVSEARRVALFDAHQRALLYANTSHHHGSLPVNPHECAAQVAMEIASSITGIDPDIRKAGYALRRKVLEAAAQKAEVIIATEGYWSNIPAAIRALKGEGDD